MSQYDIEIDDTLENTSHALILDLVGYGKTVLDIGCSTGYLARVLTGRECSVSGVEIDPAAAEKAAEVCERVLVGSLDDLDLVQEFGPASFDVVVLGDVLEHLVDPVTVLRRVTPLLRPDGYIVISVPNITHGSVRLSLLEGRFDYTEIGLLDRTHVHFFTRASLLRMLWQCGLVPVDLRRTVAEVQATEIPVDLSTVPEEVLRRLGEDRDATTYQFVVRAVVEGAGSAVASLAERMERAEQRMHELEVALASAASTAEQERRAGTEELGRVREERDRSAEQLAGLTAEVEHLRRFAAQQAEQLGAPRVLTNRLVGAIRSRVRRAR